MAMCDRGRLARCRRLRESCSSARRPGATGAVPFAVDVNGLVIAFTVAAAIVTVLILGLVPAFRVTNVHLGTGASGVRRRARFGRAATAAEESRRRAGRVVAGPAGRRRPVHSHASELWARQTWASRRKQCCSVRIDPQAVGYCAGASAGPLSRPRGSRGGHSRASAAPASRDVRPRDRLPEHR